MNIETRFFQAAHEKRAPFPESEPERDPSRPLVLPYAEIGEDFIRIITDHKLDHQCSVSIVLIAGSRWPTSWVAREFGSLLPPLDSKSSHRDPKEFRWVRRDFISGYLPLLDWCLTSGNWLSRTITRTSLIFGALLPLVYSSAFAIMDRSNRIRLTYIGLLDDKFVDSAQKNTAILDLYSQRLGLRRVVENSEDDSEQLARYITSQGLTDLENDCTSVQNYYKSVHSSALRLEAEVRDYLELQSEQMTLKESQKSISLSSLQIEEYKRGSSLHGLFEMLHLMKHSKDP